MNIFPLLEIVSTQLGEEIKELILLKAEKEEGYKVNLSPFLKQWIDETFNFCSVQSNELEKCVFDFAPADEVFRKLIRRYDHTGY